MIKYIEKLYLTENTRKKLNKIKRDIRRKKFLSLVYIIILSENEVDAFDIIPIRMMKFRKKSDDEIVILGIAENKKAAIRLCSDMSLEYMDACSELSMREYFKSLY